MRVHEYGDFTIDRAAFAWLIIAAADEEEDDDTANELTKLSTSPSSSMSVANAFVSCARHATNCFLVGFFGSGVFAVEGFAIESSLFCT